MDDPTPATLSMAAPRSASRRAARTALRVVVLGVLVGLVLQRLDLAAVSAAWRGVTPGGAVGVIACFVAAMTVRVGKWAWQVHRLDLSFDLLPLTRAFLTGIVLGAVTPLRAGEVYRLSGLRLDPARRAEQVALTGASLLLEKVYELLILVTIASAGLVRLRPGLGLGLLSGVGVAAVISLSGARPPAGWLRALPARLRRLTIDPLLQARDGLGLGGRLGLVTLTAAAHGLNTLGALGVYRAFGPMSADTLFFRMPLVTLTNALPLSIGGIGVRELAAMYIFGGATFPASSAALAASVVFVGANLLPALVLPLLALVPERRSP